MRTPTAYREDPLDPAIRAKARGGRIWEDLGRRRVVASEWESAHEAFRFRLRSWGRDQRGPRRVEPLDVAQRGQVTPGVDQGILALSITGTAVVARAVGYDGCRMSNYSIPRSRLATGPDQERRPPVSLT